ncbi:glycosyltransferase family protein [Helicobacter mesocricetorum]|uniref:hypothetical protein n=1 Tax=Helicobacter mesocricetorum TaxID=87012 RepID=UPI001315657B|nr:hypothetical protein [Helicobacter mesocricetorum]
MLEDLPYKKYILHNANNQPLSPEILASYANFTILEHPKINAIKLRYLYSFFYTFYLLITLNPKLIVVHWASRLYQNIPLSLWGRRVIVHTMGGDIDTKQDYTGKKKFFTNRLLKTARLISVKSSFLQEMLQGHNSKLKDKIIILSWGVEERFYQSITEDSKKVLQQKLFGRSFDFVFFSIRAFKPFYRQREIVESFVKYFGGQSNVALLLSNFHQDLGYFKEVSTSFTPNVFAHSIPHSQMHEYLFAIDGVISYSISDGISQSLMEALCAKKWIIANRLPNHSMLLKHKENAYLLEDIKEMKEAFTYVQNHSLNFHYFSMLDRSLQKKHYLSTLKEYFNVA